MRRQLLRALALCIFVSGCNVGAERSTTSQPYSNVPTNRGDATGIPTKGDTSTSTRAILLKWSDPITAENLGETPDPSIMGKSLAEIVGSYKAGRDDNMLCSECHNQADAPKGYSVLVSAGGRGEVKGTARMGTPALTWSEEGGWTDKFVTNATKPEELKKAFLAWKASGCPP